MPKRGYRTRVGVFIGCLCAAVSAQEVPKDLPNPEAINAYLAYLERPGYSAFAISRHGAFGASWSYGLISAAESAAIETCEQSQPISPCFVVSIDGESLQETMDVKDLKGAFRDQQGRIWPEVPPDEAPIQIARNPQQLESYREYTRLRGNKAFAAAMDGAFGVSHGHINLLQAEAAAMQACIQNTSKASNCKLVDVNNQATVARIAVAQQQPDPIEPPALAEITSDNHTRALAMRLMGEHWDTYQQAERNKAFATNIFGATGLADDHVAAMVAEEAALSTCETYNDMRRGTRYLANKVAPCVLVAVNDYYDEDTLMEILQQQASAEVRQQIVGDYLQPWHGRYQLRQQAEAPDSNASNLYFLIGARGFQLFQGEQFRASGRYQRIDNRLLLRYEFGQADPDGRELVITDDQTALYFDGSPAQRMTRSD